MNKKKNEATSVASPRSSSRSDKIKFGTDAQQELPEWAKDLPDEIVVKTWEID